MQHHIICTRRTRTQSQKFRYRYSTRTTCGANRTFWLGRKSSLAFDTIYAEGQRRFLESLSAYARQFLGMMERPEVDFIDGLSPVISIDQKTTNRNPRSTVGTVTEIYDFLRLLYARVGNPILLQNRQ